MGDQVISPNKLTDAYHLLESYSHTVCATTGSAAHGGIYPPASVSSYLINNSCVVDTRRRETNRHSVNRVVHRMRMLCSISYTGIYGTSLLSPTKKSTEGENFSGEMSRLLKVLPKLGFRLCRGILLISAVIYYNLYSFIRLWQIKRTTDRQACVCADIRQVTWE